MLNNKETNSIFAIRVRLNMRLQQYGCIFLVSRNLWVNILPLAFTASVSSIGAFISPPLPDFDFLHHLSVLLA